MASFKEIHLIFMLFFRNALGIIPENILFLSNRTLHFMVLLRIRVTSDKCSGFWRIVVFCCCFFRMQEAYTTFFFFFFFFFVVVFLLFFFLPKMIQRTGMVDKKRMHQSSFMSLHPKNNRSPGSFSIKHAVPLTVKYKKKRE